MRKLCNLPFLQVAVLVSILFFSCAKPDDPVIDNCPCGPVNSVTVSNVSTTSAFINWSPLYFQCPNYLIIIRNLDDNTVSFENVSGFSFYSLNDLEPCTNYEVGVSHTGTDCQSIPATVNFSTKCEIPDLCMPEGLNPEACHISQLGIGNEDMILWNNPNDQDGYIQFNDPIFEVDPSSSFDIVMCYSVGDDFFENNFNVVIWLDFNNNSIFESNEIIYDFELPNASYGCVLPIPSLIDAPDSGCGIKGRLIGSLEDVVGPCEDVDEGQVIDFKVNVGPCL